VKYVNFKEFAKATAKETTKAYFTQMANLRDSLIEFSQSLNGFWIMIKVV
jgi:hypothetical protein